MTDEDKISLSRRKALGAMGTIGAAGALGTMGTFAQFSDTEERVVSFTAGGLDGELEWSGSYNSNKVEDSLENVNVDPQFNSGGVGVDIHFSDIKPGDFGCVNFTITVQNNPAWVASCLDVVADDDWNQYEPELEADGDVDDDDFHGSTTSEKVENGQGELAENIYTIPYYDGDDKCVFFDPDGTVDFDNINYQGANPSAFWSNNQPNGQKVSGIGPVSVDENDNTQYYLVPRSLQEVSQQVRAVDTAHWSSDKDATLDVQTAPDGATVDAGCVMLDGDASQDGSGNNTQGVAPLEAGTPLNFGYDFHLPFGVGNEAQGDRLTLRLGFVFLQTRHTSAPNFDEYDPGSNIPNNSTSS